VEETYDVVVVGAGLSGIGAACHLARECPQESVVVLEGRDRPGGTWDLFRYPGVRSDSDMYTLAYDFAPWRSPRSIVDGAEILAYLEETARAYGVDRQVRTGHRAVSAAWSSPDARWRLAVAHDGTTTTIVCRFLWLCTGYYRYDAGYAPDLAGQQAFGGRLVDPQHWPADLDVSGADVVVLGSGATAVTLVPALAAQGARVTMLQRSPSYVAAVPREDALVRRLTGRVPARALATFSRARHLAVQLGTVAASRRRPALVRRLLLRAATRRLPPGYDVATHFSPRYDPWDQRLCVSPEGDLFTAIAEGRAEVVTGTVDALTPTGVRLTSGAELRADVLVRATGLEMLAFGGVTITVDGRPVSVGGRLAYKGAMLDGVPNLAFTLGYARASWTLRADLVAHWVTRLLRRMRRDDLAVVTPGPAPADVAAELRPLLDLSAGYVRRARGRLPEQGLRGPWRSPSDHVRATAAFRWDRRDAGLRFTRAPVSADGRGAR
jgi:monooxygenase